jgi:hypothetical protein
VEQLEKRELLNGSPLPLPHAVNPFTASPAQVASLTSPLVNKASPASWQGASQQPTSFGLPQQAQAASQGPMAQIPLVILPNESSSPNGEGYTPSQLQQAYGFNQITLPAGKTFNDAGSGQTIAIIDPLNDPYLRSDLQTFDQTFNIGGAVHDPTNTSFLTVMNQNGGSTLPDTDIYNLGVETSLDVEWAHAMAPGANILLVETSSYFTLHDLGTAIETAARQPGVSVISMSFGFVNTPTDYYLDNMFTTPAGHQGVSFVASAGDSGSYNAEYPATSPNVLGVGGTTLPADTSGNPSRAQESTWIGGGGGINSTEAEPAYQLGVQSTGSRTGPDLSYDSDPNTGVPVLDTLYGNTVFPGQNKPWVEIGGTSIAAPQISSLVAIANQLRVAAHEATLDGANQLLPAIYQIAATDPNAFHDITAGYNGHPAGPGYDFATGFGTPNAQYLVPDLVAAYRTPPAPRTVYWTGDVSTNWDTPGNWSTVDPAVKNVQQSVLPTVADRVVVDVSGATILHDAANYDTISSFTVTATKVTLDIGAGTLDLEGGGGRGTFRADQNGDVVTMEAGVLANADVTLGTSLSATSDPFGDYPELDNVQVDGTVNANQNGGNNGLYFTNGLVLNGTINLGGNNDQSSVLLAGFWTSFLNGNQDNNPETISGNGTIQLGKSSGVDGILNWGTLGTLTIGSKITVVGGGPGSIGQLEQTNDTGGIDNLGTLKMNGGTFVIEAFGPSLFGWEPSGTTGWTNEGIITAIGGATVGLLGGWTSSGKIGVDSHSTVLLGNPTTGQLPSDPDADYNTWSNTGSVTVADGATVYVGGFLTADQYQGLAAIPGVTAHPAADVRFLDGTLDNNPSDNPVSHGNLNATGTPLTLAGGTLFGGTIGAGSKLPVVTAAPILTITFYNNTTAFLAAGGWLDNLTNGGTVNVTGVTLNLSNVTNSGTVSGNSGDTIKFLKTWANAGTIKVDGTTSLYLGTPEFGAPGVPPTLADGSPYAWNPTAVGSIQVADGATIGIGGLLTTDLFTALPSMLGASIHLAHDTVLLDGWLDNSPADNPQTGGVLAFTSATGVVDLAGGLISQGTITTSGTGALVVKDYGGVFGSGRGYLDNVTNDGTITMLSGVDVLEFEGSVTNNGLFTNIPNSISSGDIILFLPGGSLTNHGSINLANGLMFCGSNVVNNGSITVDAASFEVFPFDAQHPSVTLTNAGTIKVTDSGTIIVVGGLTNTGTINGATKDRLFFEGTWDNTTGAISVDSSSILFLGYLTELGPSWPAPPSLAEFSPYALNLNQVGTIQVGNGATFGLGGLLRTDQFNAFLHLPGVHLNPSQDTFLFTGWLDNSPAANPISGGTLAINASTGSLVLNGGYVYQGKITTSRNNDLETTVEQGYLDGVELDGNLNVTGPYGAGTVIILNSLTLNGTIDMPGSFGRIGFGYFDNTPETLRGTGTIFLGRATTGAALLFDLNNAGLTIESGITIDAGASFSEFAAEGSTIENLGTLEDNTASSALYTAGFDPYTGQPYNALANYSAGTLTGGTWEVGNGAAWHVYGFDLTTNAANLSVSGAGTEILDSNGNNALAGLTTNTATGHLTVGAGYSLTVQGNFQNAGILEIAGALSIQGNYTQTAAAALDINIASPTVYGSLAVNGTATLAGTLNIALVNGFTPASGQSYTILTFGARSGDFSTKNGLVFSPSESFAATYTGNTLTLVVIP